MPTLFRASPVLLLLLGSLQAFADTDADLGTKIAAQGTNKGVAPCMTCHGPDGAGRVERKSLDRVGRLDRAGPTRLQPVSCTGWQRHRVPVSRDQRSARELPEGAVASVESGNA
jgi:hypothetical protein